MGVLFLCRDVYKWGNQWYIETNLNNRGQSKTKQYVSKNQ